ncbi:MAG: DNA-processing protein DprA [Patescibacteria group bacterium]
MFPSIKKIKFDEENYPILLKEIPGGAPETLHYLGELPTKEETIIAIVGTRKATPEGRLIAKQIGKDLAENGIVVASGLALGIDAAAHEGALAGKGKTIAVLANGLDSIYPASHTNLAKEIVRNGGAIVSEYPAGTPAYPSQFLERNRIISGLSLATIIIEAPIHSGALVTGRNAIDQGREVFVIPGPIKHPNYKGSNLFLRNGARLVASIDDIFEDLNIKKQNKTALSEIENDPQSSLIIEILKKSKESVTLDNIIEATKLEPHIVNQRLTLLMLENLVEEKNGKFKILL